MIETKNKISIHQMQILLIFNVLGSSFLTFPKLISKSANNSFLLSIIIGTCFVLLSTFLILHSLSLHESNDVEEFFQNTFGNIITKIILLIFMIKILFSLVPIITVFLKMTENILLPKTNVNIILISFLLLCCYLCYKEQSVRAKTVQLIFYILIIYILIFIIVSMFHLNLDALPNMTNVNINDLTQGSFVTLFSFSSVIYLFFDYFYLHKKNDIIKSSISVVVFIGFLFLFMSIIAISTFTLKGVTFLDFPAFDTMARLSISNSFITRSEAIVFNFWIFVIFSYVSTGIFYGHLLLYDVVKIKQINKKIYIFLFASIIFIMCSLKLDQIILKTLDIYISLFLMIILPSVIIIKKKFSNKMVVALTLLVTIFPIFLTSCTDKIELENRRFAYELYIDKDNDNFVIHYAYPDTSAISEDKLILSNATDKTLLGCINKSYIHNENIIDFRQVKTIILTKNIMEDNKMLMETFDLLSKNNQVSNNTFIVSTEDDINTLLNDKTTKETTLSFYLSNFLENNKNNYITAINFDLDSAILRIRNNQCVIIPSVKFEDNYEINGSHIFSNFEYINFMNLDLTKGYALLEDNANETAIEFNYNNKNMFTKIVHSKSKTSFYENNNKLYVVYKIKNTSHFAKPEYEYLDQNLEVALKNTINDEISNMCLDTLNYFKENNVDGLYLLDKLEKKEPKLFNKYYKDISTINYSVDVDTKITE